MNNPVLLTEYIMGKLRRVFFMAYPENRKDYKNSRIRYTIGDTMAQTINQLAGGTFLVMLMEAMGFSDGDMGILSCFGCVAATMQIVSIKLTGKIQKNKLLVCLTVLQRLWLAFIFFIPLFHMEQSTGRILMVVCYCFVQLAVQLGTPATVDWIASLTPSRIRGHYFAIKDSVAVLVIIITTLIMGIVADVAKKVNPSVFSALGWIFVSTGMLGLQLEAFPEDKRIVQYALFSVISGIYGFLVSIVAGKLINWLQSQNLTFFGTKLYAQQITNVAGCVFVGITILYISLKMQKKAN